MKREDNKQFVEEMKLELKRILNFWSNEAIDNINGGFIGDMNYKGEPIRFAEKGSVLNSRILWSFSAAYQFEPNPVYLEMAKRAYHFIIEKLWDNKHGGVVWSISPQGEITDGKKQAYAQGFCIYGLTEYYKITKDDEALNKAKELYLLLEDRFLEKEYGGYVEALSRDFSPMQDMRLSDKDDNCPKSMNTHLHILEPYSNLYRVAPSERLKQSMINLCGLFNQRIVANQFSSFNLFFENDWTSKHSIRSFGHDIEGAWLLNEAAELTQDKETIESMQQLAKGLVDHTVQNGLDKDGSIYNENHEGIIDKDRHWWPQAEAMVGLVDCYQKTNEDQYLLLSQRVWKYIKQKMLDLEKGEWYWRRQADGEINTSDPKAGFWKCPYHNSRALLECIYRLGEG